jgi:hypothetical protein
MALLIKLSVCAVVVGLCLARPITRRIASSQLRVIEEQQRALRERERAWQTASSTSITATVVLGGEVLVELSPEQRSTTGRRWARCRATPSAVRLLTTWCADQVLLALADHQGRWLLAAGGRQLAVEMLYPRPA